MTYRHHGKGQRARQAWAAPDRLPGLRAWLEELVGPLAHYAVGTGPPAPPASRPDQATGREPREADAPAAEPASGGGQR